MDSNELNKQCPCRLNCLRIDSLTFEFNFKRQGIVASIVSALLRIWTWCGYGGNSWCTRTAHPAWHTTDPYLL